MTACMKCGHDPDAKVVASWTFVLDCEVESLNARHVNAGSNAAKAKYRDARTAWEWLIRAARLEHRITPATGRRRLTLTRIYARGQRALDRDNLAGGMKPLVDAIAREGLLRDDTPAWLELHHDQEPGAERGVRVLLEDLAAEPATSAAPAPLRRARRGR